MHMNRLDFRVIPSNKHLLFNNRKKHGFLKRIFKLLKNYTVVSSAFFTVIMIILVLITFQSIAPDNFPRGTTVRIAKDMTVSESASLLKEKGVIRSQIIYKTYITLLHDGRGVQAGSYLFDKPQSALRVAYRTAYGVNELQKIKVTIPEGSSSNEIVKIIAQKIPEFDADSFLVDAKKHEGYLFPETYFFDPDIQPRDVISMMREQFDMNVGAIMDEIAMSKHSLEDILIMASILEEEANNIDDRTLISGVLWNRIEIGMPLQVDAPFYYLFGKGSSQLTVSDLATSSPYNTYKNKGLPAGPISNPGIESIRAALNPNDTDYLYYLADRSGTTHYAVTHDEHVANKAKYLQ